MAFKNYLSWNTAHVYHVYSLKKPFPSVECDKKPACARFSKKQGPPFEIAFTG